MKKLVLLFCFIAATQQFAPAQTPALSFTGGSFLGANAGTYGWAFTLSNTITVTDLGYFDFGGNGLNQSHDVGIWTSSGTLLVSATVPSGTAGTLIDGFRYTLITPTILPPGDYVIGGFESGSSGDPIVVTATTITTASGITYNGSAISGATSFSFPSEPGQGNSYFGPNFEFNNVPEPTTVALLVLGGLTAGFVRKR